MAIFDYAAPLKNVALLLGAAATKTTESLSTTVMFQALFNPGHNGKANWLEYDFRPSIHATTKNNSVTVKWQIRDSGATTWQTIFSTTRTSTGGAGSQITRAAGIHNTTSKMPIAVRLTLTDTTRWSVTISTGSNICAIRAIGTAT